MQPPESMTMCGARRFIISLTLLSISSLVPCSSSSSFPRLTPSWLSRLQFSRRQKKRFDAKLVSQSLPSRHRQLVGISLLRGGDDDDAIRDADEERYSRQVYTLGARAHSLVRSSTIFIDGPSNSGLVYECAKNLALSGVGSIVILVNDDENETEEAYHKSELDDLGNAYQRAAKAEIGHEAPENDETVLLEYLKRLNPSVSVSIAARSDLSSTVGQSPGVLLCVDRPYSSQVLLNNKCRKEGLAFVTVETAGVYGRVFCDFGHSFQVVDGDGETPLVVPLDRVELLENDLVQVHCIQGEKHDVSKGDCVRFRISNGEILSVECTVVKVKSPRLFTVSFNTIDNDSLQEMISQVNDQAVSFSRIKIPQEVRFVPLEEATLIAKDDGSLFTPCDLEKSFDITRRKSLFACFEAVEDFVKKHGRLPSKVDVDAFTTIAQARLVGQTDRDTRTIDICKSFCQCCSGKLTPIQSILGAIGAQEVLKATCGLYNPVRQFLLYDCDELLPNTCDNDDADGATGQSYVLGQSVCKRLADRHLFVVGAGAIGCELLKNLAAMGAGTGAAGRIIVTDMDTIEKSNLSRQLLFRDGDIGKFKSSAAYEALQRFNSGVNAEVHTSKVGDDEHGPFNDIFWSREVDTVLNALDNMEARLYIDGRCVAHQKSLIDAGTLGPKGNVQVVVPHKSESYGSSVDPPEPAIPVCTLKTFPYSISHTIQWARDLFDGCFQTRPKQANDYAKLFPKLGVDGFIARLIDEVGEEQAYEIANELKEDWEVGTENESSSLNEIREVCIQWAANYAKELFNDSIEALLRQHPIDSVDEDGEVFWSGTRRVPKALSYVDSATVDSQQDLINNNLVDFVRFAARLRSEIFLPAGSSPQDSTFGVEEAIQALRRLKFGVKDIEKSTGKAFDEMTDCFRGVSPTEDFCAKLAEFEKDDETNGHVAFVTAASNLRALCYGIAPVDAMETRRVAGRIVPAMISTTAFVSALSCVELLKLLQDAPLERHRNAFVNLALPFFAYTAPVPADQIEGLHGTTYTLWDRITIKEGKKSAKNGGITLRKFLKSIPKNASKDPDSISISTVSYGPYMLYANFLHEDDDVMLGRPVLDLLREAILSGEDDEFMGRDADAQAASADQQIASLESHRFFDFTVVVEDVETGEETELPPVRLLKRDN